MRLFLNLKSTLKINKIMKNKCEEKIRVHLEDSGSSQKQVVFTFRLLKDRFKLE